MNIGGMPCWARISAGVKAGISGDFLGICCDSALDNIGNSAKVRYKAAHTTDSQVHMKNVYEVLRQKEMELSRLEREVEALRLVAPLLSEEKEMNSDMAKPALATAVGGPQQPIRMASPVAANAQPARVAGWDDTAKRWP